MHEEDFYTLVDKFNRPVYTDGGMDGHFRLCSSFSNMMTFSRRIGWSNMMHLASWSQQHTDNGRIQVYPAKVSISFTKIDIE